MRNGGQQDERQDDLQRMGIAGAQAQAWLAEMEGSSDHEDGAAGDEQPGDALQVWPENRPALLAWMALQTQWHRGLMGGLQGLRHDAAEAMVARMMRGASQDEQDLVFMHLVEMEQAALEALDGS